MPIAKPSKRPSLHKRLKQMQRRFFAESAEAFGLHLLAVYRAGYREGYEDGRSDAEHLHLWR